MANSITKFAMKVNILRWYQKQEGFSYIKDFDTGKEKFAEIQKIHYERNADLDPTPNYLDTIYNKYGYLNLSDGKSVFHQLNKVGGDPLFSSYLGPTDTGNDDNTKWTTLDGKSEYVFKYAGTAEAGGFEIVSSPLNYGTYNFVGASESGHLAADVYTWILWGNTAEDAKFWTVSARLQEFNSSADNFLSDLIPDVRWKEFSGLRKEGNFTRELIGTGESDTVSYIKSKSAVSASLDRGEGFDGYARNDRYVGVENLTGSNWGDILIGDDGDNVLTGLVGRDSLLGGRGQDTLAGGAGDDFVRGGRGDDLIIADDGSDFIYGDLGHDTMTYVDYYRAGKGLKVEMDNILYVTDSKKVPDTDTLTNVETLLLGAGDDEITVSGDLDYYEVDAGGGYDVLKVETGGEILIRPNGDIQLANGAIFKSIEKLEVDPNAYKSSTIVVTDMAALPEIQNLNAGGFGDTLTLDFSQIKHSLNHGQDSVSWKGESWNFADLDPISVIGTNHGDTWSSRNSSPAGLTGGGDDTIDVIDQNNYHHPFFGGDDVIRFDETSWFPNLHLPDTVDVNSVSWNTELNEKVKLPYVASHIPQYLWKFDLTATIPDHGSVRFENLGVKTFEPTFKGVVHQIALVNWHDTTIDYGQVYLDGGLKKISFVVTENGGVSGTFAVSQNGTRGDDNYYADYPDGTNHINLQLLAGDDIFHAIPIAKTVVYGGQGHDTYHGTAEQDNFYGGFGDDVFHTGGGADTFWAGPGNDTMIWKSSEATALTQFVGGAGYDTLRLELRSSDVTPENAKDIAEGINYLLIFTEIELGADNYLSFANDLVRAWDIEKIKLFVDGAVVKQIQSKSGTGGSDMMFNKKGHTQVHGWGGDDIIYGNDNLALTGSNSFVEILKGDAGRDILYGLNGADKLVGGKGTDQLYGGQGNDILIGGAGKDAFYFHANTGEDTVEDFKNGEKLHFEEALWGGKLSTAEFLAKYAEVDGSDTVFEFEHDVIRIEGTTGLTVSDIVFV